MSYRCNRQYPCKHFTVEYEVFPGYGGDTEVSNAQWRCMKRDDERCVPNCKDYERRERR